MKVAKKFNMLKSLKGNNNKGFSLVELIIIIAILAILVAILSPMYFQYVEDTQDDILRSAAEQVHSVVQTEVALENIKFKKGGTMNSLTVTVQADSNNQIQFEFGEIPGWGANPEVTATYILFMDNNDSASSALAFSQLLGNLGESESDLIFTFTVTDDPNDDVDGVVIGDLVEN